MVSSARFSQYNFVEYALLIPHGFFMPHPCNTPWFDRPNSSWRTVQLWSSALCSFLHSPVTSSLFGPNCLICNMCWTRYRPFELHKSGKCFDQLRNYQPRKMWVSMSSLEYLVGVKLRGGSQSEEIRNVTGIRILNLNTGKSNW